MHMAPVRTLHRLVWGGRLFDTESWSCSLHFDAQDEVTLPASVFATDLVAWMTSAGARISGSAVLDFIKFNRIAPATGRYFNQQSNTHDQLDMATGTVERGEGQISVAVSTRTALARGRGHAGRFYPPTADLPIQIDGRITALLAQDMANAAAALISGLNDTTLAEGGQAVVFSKVAQTVEPILSVRVGRVPDTIRSRRSSLVEDPQSALLT